METSTFIFTPCGQKIIIDIAEKERLSKYTWRLRSGYPGCHIGNKYIRLSRFLMNPAQNEVVDHINRNTLDQRRSNLRCVNRELNSHNRERPSHRQLTSKYRGVSYIDGKWMSAYSTVRLGSYKDEDDAARAYNIFVSNKFGDDAILNEVDMSVSPPPRKPKRGTNGSIKRRKDGTFVAQFEFNKATVRVGTYSTEVEAEEAIKIEKKRLTEAAKYNNGDITKNSEGIAYFTVSGSQVLCDDEIWRQYSKRRMHISFYGYTMLGRQFFHRVITNCPNHLMIDHINRNKLDCRRENLRQVTAQENQRNRSKALNASSQFFGVVRNVSKTGIVTFTATMKGCHIMYHRDEARVAFAYDTIAHKFFPDCVRVNGIKSTDLNLTISEIEILQEHLIQQFQRRLDKKRISQ